MEVKGVSVQTAKYFAYECGSDFTLHSLTLLQSALSQCRTVATALGFANNSYQKLQQLRRTGYKLTS